MPTEAGGAGDHLYLVDGSGYIFRAYHALPPLTRADGTPVNAVLGFSNILARFLSDLDSGDRPTHLAVVFDAGRTTFRNEIYPDYKAHRPPAPEDLVPQFALIREATHAFNVAAIEVEGFEADDVIATLAVEARRRGVRCTVVSSDKDLMQLVGGPVDMLDPVKIRRIGPDEVVEKFGVPPEKVVDVQSLMGDSVDNVPGVPGIGQKTAAELINLYGDLDTLLARAGEIKQPKRRENLQTHADLARVSRELVRLKADVPLPLGFDDLKVRPLDGALLLPFLEQNDFKSLRSKLGGRVTSALAGAANRAADAAAGPPPAPAPETPGTADYVTVTDEAALAAWIARARAAGTVAFDTETTSLDAMQAELVGFSLAIEAGRAAYVPLRHRPRGGLALDGDVPAQIPFERALDLLRPLLAADDVLKIGQNLKYDMLVLRKYGIAIAPLDDTMLISYALEGGAHGHGMDELAGLHLGHETVKYDAVTGTGKDRIGFDEVSIADATRYAAEDADVTLRLHAALKPRLFRERVATVYETLERPLPQVLIEMEAAGILVDRAELARLSGDFAHRMSEMEGEIHALAGRSFNVGSPKQLGEILFDEMKLPGGKRMKTGAWGTGADVLEDLADQGHELPRKILDWRQLAKLKSTYTDALQGQINPATGRVHTSYALASTSTGRLSSTDPNLQNIPIRTEEGRKIRRAFVAAPGHVLMSADYSQIELRLLAHIAGIDSLKAAFARGMDIHAMTASEVFGLPVEGMDPMVRRRAKAINFGIIYGISAFGLANQLGIPQGEASAYIKRYFERFPGIRAYMEATKETAHRQGFVTTVFGRKCHVPGINDKSAARRAFMERAAINAPIQGSAADIMRRAMIRMPAALKAAGLKAKMLLQVHDELVFEVPEDEVEATRPVVIKVMEGAALPAVDISVPLVVEAGTGRSWAEAH
ncbi:DNA polymerase I [Zavarzinia compransoris]|uniref:DNA polymerase I n=1 Tax=Zavarzinia compransoris TaxID=1264899 RepID=A0A317DXW7_9PROT|nr:DNA polymerase I [Zavarzinia compransoris]PWR18780.1 DNA polymerase I [Zavarzinia compransoris]TDP48765.1 DNA polymerase I [Zavarzinia compransoris]